MKLTGIQMLQLDNFASRNNIRFIVLFGSQTQALSQEGSDYDIAVSLKGGKSFMSDFDVYSQILDGLSTILQIAYEKIDLTDLDNANILLRYEVTCRGKLLYGDELEYLELKSFAYRDYIDAKRLFDLERDLIGKRQKMILESLDKIISK
ncbi:MAG: hypothetical protein A2Y48_10465 [Nitrospirae bacterium RIFCSPLOW2_12_42_9]|nr:MAG: hypothetical protein A2Y48_10465 [Nitrospirae bacterium RIFCSPLOW2_12_42_9]